jgi:hypothetical protein
VSTGYSGTPLGKKLGVLSGQKTWRVGMPDTVATEIASEGLLPDVVKRPQNDLQMVHLFVTRQSDLVRRLAEARPLLAQTGMIWVSWPKKASGVKTDISDSTIREVAFSLGLVDVKVCAVDEVWSGLKLVIRKCNRV